MCARLTRDPWFLSIEQIADLTDEQISEVYLRRLPEDEVSNRPGAGAGPRPKGKVYRDGEPKPWTPLTKAQFAKVWRACGKTDAWINELWAKDYPDQPQ